jgi:16S rRNA (cytidine1402-2'-O)-methyltransferase
LPGLYIVATPIGNIRDITLRALDILASADVLACEDTRVTQKLLRAYDITAAKIFPYHEHNAESIRPKLMARLRAGEKIALISDAGTPLVSDPGYKLVREATQENIAVYAVPGASASLAALVSAGLPTDRFLFAGFLSSRRAARRQSLQEIATIQASLVFFESARRLAHSLADLSDILGARQAAVARELTKLHEEVRRGRLDELAAHYAVAGAPKGEVVIVVAPPDRQPPTADIDRMLRDALGDMSLRDAAAAVSEASGQPRRKVYARALELAKGKKRSPRHEP